MEISYKYYALELLLRVFCGILFLFQGYDKLFKIKISGVVSTYKYEALNRNIPVFALKVVATYTSIVEFFGGLLLILGLFKNYALCALGIDLILVAAAFSFVNPIWDMKYVFPRLIMIILLLFIPTRWAYFSIDHLLRFVFQF